MTDNERYNQILKLAEEFDDPRQQVEIGKHLCLRAASHLYEASFWVFVESLFDRMLK